MDEAAAEHLKVAVRDLDAVRREVEVEGDAAETAKEYDEVLSAYARKVKLRGFRQGAAPREMVKKMYGPEVEHDLVDRLIPRLLEEALSGRRIPVVGVPAVSDVHFEEGRGLRFKAVVEVWPEFDLPPYTKLKLRRPESAVTDEDIAQSLEDLRRKNADYVPVEGRGAAAGDYAVVELQGRDTKTRRLLPAEKAVLLVGREGNDPEVDSHIQGLRPSEERTFVASYPEDHPVRKRAGKTIEFKLKLVSLKEMKYPEVNDDFAKHLGEFEDLAGLKDKIRRELAAARTKAAQRAVSEQAVQAVADRVSFDLPPSVLEEETEAVLRSFAAQIGKRAVTREAAEALKAQALAQARKNLKQHLVIRKIARAEGLAVTEEDLDQEIRAIAQESQVPLARAMETFREEERKDNLKASLLARKVVDFLVGQAIIE
ncbi:MAG: trigger factor [Candidatus Aminicenantes bacterium]|nr:trigger factor [Candidatus Aminicenantes bacterium]